MALAIFFGGIFLGFIFGFVIMALLALASLPSKPGEQRQWRVQMLPPAPSPAACPLCEGRVTIL